MTTVRRAQVCGEIGVVALVAACVALGGGESAAQPEVQEAARAAVNAEADVDPGEAPPPDDDRKRRAVEAGALALVAIVVVGLALLAFVVFYGGRLRRLARASTAPTAASSTTTPSGSGPSRSTCGASCATPRRAASTTGSR